MLQIHEHTLSQCCFQEQKRPSCIFCPLHTSDLDYYQWRSIGKPAQTMNKGCSTDVHMLYNFHSGSYILTGIICLILGYIICPYCKRCASICSDLHHGSMCSRWSIHVVYLSSQCAMRCFSVLKTKIWYREAISKQCGKTCLAAFLIRQMHLTFFLLSCFDKQLKMINENAFITEEKKMKQRVPHSTQQLDPTSIRA